MLLIARLQCSAPARRCRMQARASRPSCSEIGINLGDVIIEHNDIYGDGVNIAARLEYSCSGSPDMFVNGKTAIDGVSTLGAGLAASACLAVTSVLPGCHFQNSDRTIDVLDAYVAAILETNVNSIANAFVDDRGDADPAGLSERLALR